MKVTLIRETHEREADLARAWQANSWARGLRSTAGLSLQVVYPGRPASEAGPDFRGAVIALPRGELLRGDVELHLDESDWWRHGHHQDGAYDGVVLHVARRPGRGARKANGEPILTAIVGGSPVPAAAGASAGAGVAPCRRVLPRLTPSTLDSLLRELAAQRFRSKQAAFEGQLAVDTPSQALYAGLLEALGYNLNRAPFRRLAELLPLAALEGVVAARPSEGSAARLRRLLLHSAGLEPNAQFDGWPSLPPTAWRWQGVRPGNLPPARLAALAELLPGLLEEGLVEALLAPLDAAIREDVGGRPWHAWRGALRPLGRARVDSVALNVLLPFAAALGETSCRYLLAEAALEVYLAYPGRGSDQITRTMQREVLAPAGVAAAGPAREQALHQVWAQWCHDKTCARCPLGGSAPA
ncbi:MAG: DUF2851 family protein, partial [Chloroflexota bacterium]